MLPRRFTPAPYELERFIVIEIQTVLAAVLLSLSFAEKDKDYHHFCAEFWVAKLDGSVFRNVLGFAGALPSLHEAVAKG